MKAFRLFLSSLILGLATLSLTGQQSLPVFPKKPSKEAVKAEKHFEYLKAKDGYTPLGTLMYRSRKELPKSLLTLKNTYIYTARIKPFADIEQLISPSDQISRSTLERYKQQTLPPAPVIDNDLLDGWLAVHYFKTQTAQDSLGIEQAMVFVLDEKLENLLDAGEWYAFDYDAVVKHLRAYRAMAEKQRQSQSGIDSAKPIEGDIVEAPEVLPKYGEGLPDLSRYLASTVQYPEICAQMGIQGRVAIRFVVEVDGSISSVEVLSGVENSMDLEAMRVILSMPRWSPGTQGGTAVRCRLTIPIAFRLE